MKLVKAYHNGVEYLFDEYQEGWKPGANTYIYYPLTENLIDQMGNGSTGVATGAVTFNKNPGATTGCHVQGQSGIYVTGMSLGINGRTTCTLSYRANFVSQDQYAALVGHCSNVDSGEPSKLVCDDNLYTRLGLKASGGNFYYTNAYAKPINDGYHHYCLTMDNGTLRMYFDGMPATFMRNGSGSYESYSAGTIQNGSGAAELQLGWGGTYGSSRRSTGYVRDYIVETAPRTAQEIADYYQNTKENYGL